MLGYSSISRKTFKLKVKRLDDYNNPHECLNSYDYLSDLVIIDLLKINFLHIEDIENPTQEMFDLAELLKV
jgi:hypothetical protein